MDEVEKYTTDNLPKVNMNKFVLRVGTTSKSLFTNGKNSKNPSAGEKARWKYVDEIEARFNCTIQPVYYDSTTAAEKFTCLLYTSIYRFSVSSVFFGDAVLRIVESDAAATGVVSCKSD